MQHSPPKKAILRSLAQEVLPTPPIWMMRQAGRYLPEYRATRAKAGDFLSLCYTPELAAEVTLQPIRRYQFDAAILFADILLLPQALGPKLWFVTGEGPRMETTTTPEQLNSLKPIEDIHETLSPVYETIRILASELPKDTTLIGFAGAPWTVATYMIAGRGSPDQAAAHKLKSEDPETFSALIDIISAGTIEYLSAQIEAGAEVVKLFDSWAGSLEGADFHNFCVKPTAQIIQTLKLRFPNIPIIAFPRGAKEKYIGFSQKTNADCVALDQDISVQWAAKNIQSPHECVQGNLDPKYMVTGGAELVSETRKIVEAFKNGPHIMNLGHGVTPDANPDNVQKMVDAVRG